VRRLTEWAEGPAYAEDVPHLVELFYSEHCFGCGEARQLLRRLASDHPEVVVVERNIEDDGDYRLATEYNLIATPAFVIDRSNILYGIPQPERLLTRIAASTPVLA
jgi:hypothetical protein